MSEDKQNLLAGALVLAVLFGLLGLGVRRAIQNPNEWQAPACCRRK